MKEFKCLDCQNYFNVDDGKDKPEVICPNCKSNNSEPTSSATTPKEVIFCTKCGKENLFNLYKCEACATLLHGPLDNTHIASADSGITSLVPYKNACGLAAYYLGVFSLIPCFGIPLAVAALITGYSGLRNAKKNPQIKGKVHAWVGIVLGGLVLIVQGLVVALLVSGKFD